jgi:hypothetical protein
MNWRRWRAIFFGLVACVGCGGAPPDVVETSGQLVGSPGYRSQFGIFEYACNGVWHNNAIDITVGRTSLTSYARLASVPWQYPDYMSTVTQSPATVNSAGFGYVIPLVEGLDGPYNVAYNSAAIDVSIRHGNNNAELFRATIPSNGLAIYQAGQIPSYPAGAYVFTLDIPAPCAQRAQVVIDQGLTHVTH